MRKKRLIAVISVLFCIMLIIATAGCTPKGGQTSTQQPGTGTQEPVKTETPSGKTVELRVESFDRGTPGQTPVDNNYWTK